jgi:Tol biopolymer transport system component
MADLVIELEEVRTESSSKVVPAPAPRRRRRQVWMAASTAVVGGALFTGWLLRPKPTPPPPPVAVPLTSFPGDEFSPALSPDGRQAAFSWNGENRLNRDIYVMQVGSTAPLRLTTNPATEDTPAWSPDATQLSFVRREPASASLWLISTLGGPERKLVDLRGFPTQAHWTPDGRHIVLDVPLSDTTNDVIRVTVATSEVTSLMSAPKGRGRHQYPAVSPDGKFLAFAYATGPIGIGADLHVVPLGGGGTPTAESRRLASVPGGFDGIAWSADSRSLIYAASVSKQLWRVPLSGPAERVLIGIVASAPTIAGARLGYVRADVNPDLWKAEPGGQPAAFSSSNFDDYDPQLSPDGTKITFVSSRSGDFAIWVANADGANPVRLTQETGRRPGSPHWSPDGRQIAYETQLDDGHSRIFMIDAVGGRPRRLTTTTRMDDEAMPTWSRDGNFIYFRSVLSGRNEIWKAPSGGGEALQVTRAGAVAAWESWDGRTLYYTKGATSRLLLAMPVEGGAERRVLDSVYSWFYVPARNGIYFIARPSPEDLYRYEVRFHNTTTGKTTVVNRFEARAIRPALTVSTDGKTIIFSVIPFSANADLMLVDHFR